MDGNATSHETTIQHIALDLIDESPTNPRKHFDPEKLAELAADIAQHDVIQAVILRPKGERFELVVGARRTRASGMAGRLTIPAVVRELDDRRVLEMQISENAQRSDVHPLEECDGFAMMLDTHHASVEEIAACVGKPTGYVTQRLRYRHLGPEGREAFIAGRVTAGVALLVARVPLHAQAEATIAVGPDWRGELVTVGHARGILLQRFTLRLATAPFDRADAALVPGAGPCTTCPKRTGNQGELFDDVDSPDTCTDPKCFNAKRDAHTNRLLEEHKAKGREVLDAEKAREVFSYGDQLHYGSKYAKLTEKPREYGDGDTTWKKLLKGVDVPVVVAPTNDGKFVELVLAADLKKAAKKLKLEKRDPNARTLTPEQLRRKAQRAAVLGAIATAVQDKPFDDSRAFWHALGTAVVDIAGYHYCDEVVERRALSEKNSPEEALLDELAVMGSSASRALLVELLVSRFLGPAGDLEEPAVALFEYFGVDAEGTAEQAAKDFDAAAKKSAPPPPEPAKKPAAKATPKKASAKKGGAK